MTEQQQILVVDKDTYEVIREITTLDELTKKHILSVIIGMKLEQQNVKIRR